jgi:hypothetical protein
VVIPDPPAAPFFADASETINPPPAPPPHPPSSPPETRADVGFPAIAIPDVCALPPELELNIAAPPDAPADSPPPPPLPPRELKYEKEVVPPTDPATPLELDETAVPPDPPDPIVTDPLELSSEASTVMSIKLPPPPPPPPERTIELAPFCPLPPPPPAPTRNTLTNFAPTGFVQVPLK